MPINEILILHHSHVDRGYMHHPTLTESLQASFLDQAMGYINHNGQPEADHAFRWTIETTAPLVDWWSRASNTQKQTLRDYVASGHLGIGAMAWHTTPLATHADWQRMLAPLPFLREATGDPLRTAIQHDVNGLPWGCIDKLLEAGVDTLLMGINIHMGGFPGQCYDVFNWESPSGQHILVHNGEHYGTFQRVFNVHADKTLQDMYQGWQEYAAHHSLPEDRDWLLMTATAERIPDCNAPWPLLDMRIKDWNDAGLMPRLRLVTSEQVREKLHQMSDLKVMRGDWTDYWNFGCGSTALANTRSRHARVLLDLADTVHDGESDHWTPLIDKANDALCRYNEHTWGSRGTCVDPCRSDYWQQNLTKQNFAAEAAGIADGVWRVRLDRRLNNPIYGIGCNAIALVNPEDCTRWLTPRAYDQWLTGQWRHGVQELLACDDEIAMNFKPSTRIAPIEVPAKSYRIMPVNDISTETSEELSIAANLASTPFHRIHWDPSNGKIRHFESDDRKIDLVNGESAWPCLHPIIEMVDADLPDDEIRKIFHPTDFDKIHDGQSCWNPDWPAKRIAPDTVLDIQCTSDAGGIHLMRKWALEVIDGWVSVTIHLPLHHEEAIAIELDAQLPEDHRPIGLYLSFPFNLAEDWQASFNQLNTEILLDEEQLPGSCRDWLTVDAISIWNNHDRYTLHCPDAPLVMPNGFGFAQKRASIPRNADPLLLAWVANTYWDTNFPSSQPGWLHASWWLEITDPDQATPSPRRLGYRDQLAHPVFSQHHDEVIPLTEESH